VTHYIDEQASAEWLLGEEGSACLRLLAERGVILSLACGALQVPVVAQAAASHPDLTVLVHHMGRPKSGSAGMLSAVLAGAAASNVFVKISGFGYGVDEGWDFPYPTMQETARALRDAFRADRLCWGSDYPVVRRFMTYAQSLEIVRSHCGFFSTQEREQVLGATMARLLARAAERRGMYP
jgi:predicted TIM-barrel fold metal-dependent hydrolase